jgi:glycosyltransferase involved in cell wall biosynthesis
MASHGMTEPGHNMRLHIVYVWDADYPWDVRTEKTCLALTQAGHDVHIVARNRKHSAPLEILPEATVHRMPSWRFVGRKLDAALGFPAFFSPRWRSLILDTAREVKADIIIVRDVPLCPTAISAGRQLGIPVVLDMAENYPAMMRDIWTAGRHHLTDYLVRNPRLTEIVEKYCIRHADHIITVVEASSERLEKLGVPKDRLTVVSNTPPIARTAGRPKESPAQPQPDDRIKVVYLGLLEVPRGLNDLIDAIKLLHDSGHAEFRAMIIGTGRDESLFHERARALNLPATDIEFFGHLPHQAALSMVASADIGVIPHHANESWNTTIPNKLFDYMSLGLPVVSSDARPCQIVLEETLAGSTFRTGDPGSMASALLGYASPSVRTAAGQAGVAAVRSRYNWETDSARLNDLIHRIVEDGGLKT